MPYNCKTIINTLANPLSFCRLIVCDMHCREDGMRLKPDKEVVDIFKSLQTLVMIPSANMGL